MQGMNDIQSQSLSAQIYQRLKYQLMSARLRPGDRLKIRDLAQSLGTSETPAAPGAGAAARRAARRATAISIRLAAGPTMNSA